MSSRLEDFIQNNREQFDTDEPGPQLWKKLEKQLSPAAKKGTVIRMTFLRWSAVAAVFVLAVMGVFFLFGKKGSNNTETAYRTPAVNTPDSGNKSDIYNDINPTYAKEVYHFTQLIELKQSELKQIEKDHPELYRQFVTDINKLDSSYNSLKKELPDNPNREQLLEAMIQNLRLQTELLNQQLQVIQTIKQSKSNTNANNSKST